MCGGGSKTNNKSLNFQKQQAAQARVEEDARQARISSGMEQIGSVFTPLEDTLTERRAAMEGFYLPQLDKSFDRSKEQTLFALARAGQISSSTAGKRQGDLSEAFGLERAKIDADISSDIASTRSSMNSQRSALEAALRASGDDTAATNAALSSAVSFREDRPTLNPLGNLFYGLAEGIGGVRDGYDAGRIARIATPSSLSKGTGRVVGA